MSTETTKDEMERERERLHEEAVACLRRSGFGVVGDSGDAVIVINPQSETLYGPRSTATRYASAHIAISELVAGPQAKQEGKTYVR